MSVFKVGETVRVISLTDIDAERDDPNRVMTTNEELAAAGWDASPAGPVIGDSGVVTKTYCDYYDLSIRLDRTDDDISEEFAMVDADLRRETDPCEKGTVGCSVRHLPDRPYGVCETW